MDELVIRDQDIILTGGKIEEHFVGRPLRESIDEPDDCPAQAAQPNNDGFADMVVREQCKAHSGTSFEESRAIGFEFLKISVGASKLFVDLVRMVVVVDERRMDLGKRERGPEEALNLLWAMAVDVRSNDIPDGNPRSIQAGPSPSDRGFPRDVGVREYRSSSRAHGDDHCIATTRSGACVKQTEAAKKTNC